MTAHRRELTVVTDDVTGEREEVEAKPLWSTTWFVVEISQLGAGRSRFVEFHAKRETLERAGFGKAARILLGEELDEEHHCPTCKKPMQWNPEHHGYESFKWQCVEHGYPINQEPTP